MTNEMKRNIMSFKPFFQIFSAFQGCLDNRICLPLSPSIQYSIRLNTISIKMVCGQIQPQKMRPNATVKNVINTTPIIMEITNKKKSWGQNGNPKILKRRSKTLNIKNWFPFIFIKGAVNKNTNNAYLTHYR